MNRLLLALPLLAGCIIPVQPANQGSNSGGGGGVGGDPYAAPAGDPSGGGGGSEPAGPQTVSVTIRSSCSETVKVFYGDKPKYGSGTNSTISSNSVQSHTFQVGDMFWLIDDSENGLDSVTVDAGTGTIEVSSDCRSLR